MTERGRQALPIPDRVLPGLTTYDAKDPDTVFPPIESVRPPAGAPNVVVVLRWTTWASAPPPRRRAEEADHLITPEERRRVALNRQ
jgi:hypothetical protein